MIQVIAELTQKRAQQIKVAREALMIQLAEALRKRLLSGDPEFAKPYLNALVSEIVVEGHSATMRGSHAALASAIAAQKKKGTQNQVPTFMGVWCARRDSNSLPLGS